MRVRLAVAVVLGIATPFAPLAAQWAPPKCDLKPGHYLINSAVLYVRNATNTRYEDQRKKDLTDADRVLTQAITINGQDKNGAAWYWLGRRYVLESDLVGADTAFTRAEQLAPQCAQDIQTWRRYLWGTPYNRGVQAYQANAFDTAIVYFRRASQIYREPNGLAALGQLYGNQAQLAGQRVADDSAQLRADSTAPRDSLMAHVARAQQYVDSAAEYFRRAAAAATGADTQAVRQRREAMFNRGAVYNQARRWPDSEDAFRAYLAAFPDDVQAVAGLATAFAQTGRRDSALVMYRQVVANARSAEVRHLFQAGVEMYNSAPMEPDSSEVVSRCREKQQPTRTRTARQIAAACETAARDTMAGFRTNALPFLREAASAFDSVLAKTAADRNALFNLTNTYYRLDDRARMLATVQRLHALDPMNRSVLMLLAQAWRLNGNTDSTLHYLMQGADSVLQTELSVFTFVPSDQGASLRGTVTSLTERPTTPFTLVVQFLNGKGEVVVSQDVELPALEPGAVHPLEINVVGRGIMAYGYRRK